VKSVTSHNLSKVTLVKQKEEEERKPGGETPFFLSFFLSYTRIGRACVLLCFVDPILGNRYGPGVIP